MYAVCVTWPWARYFYNSADKMMERGLRVWTHPCCLPDSQALSIAEIVALGPITSPVPLSVYSRDLFCVNAFLCTIKRLHVSNSYGHLCNRTNWSGTRLDCIRVLVPEQRSWKEVLEQSQTGGFGTVVKASRFRQIWAKTDQINSGWSLY